MAYPELHGKILVEVERRFQDECNAQACQTVKIMEDGVVLICTTRIKDSSSMSAWLSSISSSGWKLATRVKLPPEACTDAVARWILEQPEKALASRTLEQLFLGMEKPPSASSGASGMARIVPGSSDGPRRRRKQVPDRPVEVEPVHEVPAVVVPAEATRCDEVSPAGEPERRGYANVGRSNSEAKGAASRENGKRGGRPRKWSRALCALAAEGVRELAQRYRKMDRKLESQLLGLARALEQGKL